MPRVSFALKTEEVELKFEELESNNRLERDELESDSESPYIDSTDAEELYHCSTCNTNFHRNSTYTAHMKRWHHTNIQGNSASTEETYFCDDCNRTFANKFNYEKHLKLSLHEYNASNSTDTSDTNKVYCEVCCIKYSRSHNYRRHLTTIAHRQKSVQEPETPNSTNTNDTSKVYCEVCCIKYSSSHNYQRHLTTIAHKYKSSHEFDPQNSINISDNSEAYCEVCCTKFSSKRSYQRHLTTIAHKHKSSHEFDPHNSTNISGTSKVYCEVCCTDFSSKRNYLRHMNSFIHRQRSLLNPDAPNSTNTDNTDIFHCKVCCIKFKSEEEYREHQISSRHRKNSFRGSNRVYCDVCCITFSKLYGYKRHLLSIAHRKAMREGRTNTESSCGEDKVPVKGPVYCKECDLTFAERQSFYKHFKLSIVHVDDNKKQKSRNLTTRRVLNRIKKREPFSLNGVRTPSAIKKKGTKSFFCKDCRKELSHKRRVDQHYNSLIHRNRSAINKKCNNDISGTTQNVKNLKYSCELCENKFDCVSNFAIHVRNFHDTPNKPSSTERNVSKYPDPTNPYNYCRVCTTAHSDLTRYRQHLYDVHNFHFQDYNELNPVDGKVYSIDDNETDCFCYLCQTVYEPDKYMEHLSRKHKAKQFGTALENRINRLKPIPDPTDPNYYCRACKESYSANDDYQRHLREVHDFKFQAQATVVKANQITRSSIASKDELNFCYGCQKKHLNRTDYRRHMISKHGVSIPTIQKFKNPTIIPDPNDPNFYCRSCDKSYYFLSNYRNHLRNSHLMVLEPFPNLGRKRKLTDEME